MRQENDYREGRYVVSALNVHLVFVTKYRRGVLTCKQDTLREVFASIGDQPKDLIEGERDARSRARILPAQLSGRPRTGMLYAACGSRLSPADALHANICSAVAPDPGAGSVPALQMTPIILIDGSDVMTQSLNWH
jgi:hypothetical protein